MPCYSSKNIGGSFAANGRAVLLKANGYDIHGQARYRKAGVYPIQIVKLITSEKLSSIRVDTSASKSTIDEELYDGLIYMTPGAKVKVSDGIEIKSNDDIHRFRVKKTAEIFNLMGKILYVEVGLERLAS